VRRVVLFARDIVEKDFISMEGKTSAFEAAKVMRDRRHGFVVVSGGDGRPVGIVTEWDYISKVAAEGRDPSGVALEEIMSTNLVSVNDDWGIDQVSQFMTENGIRRVLVLHKGTVIGVITSKTVLSALKNYLDTVSVQIARLQGPWR
jgi:CBS domain-containing protein